MAAFMKLGDIKGESVVAPDRADQDWVVADNGDQVAQFTTGGGGDSFHGNAAGDPLHTEEIISNHGNRTNWDVICDVGTSIKQTSVAESLTNYRPEGFSEVGIRFVQSVDNDHDPGSQLNQGDPFSELDQGVFAPVNVLRSDNRFVIEPVNLFQGLDAGGMNYAEAVGLDSWQGSVDKMPALLNPNKCLN